MPDRLLHGVFLEVLGLGVLITGDAAVGKSELALELVTRGHHLIADDVVEARASGANAVEGRCPALLQDFMEVRGLGLLNIRRLFGESAVKPRQHIRLIIHLTPVEHWHELNRLEMHAGERDILGVPVPEVRLPVAAGRNLAVLVETAVRNHRLRLSGVHAPDELIERQRLAIEARADPRDEETAS